MTGHRETNFARLLLLPSTAAVGSDRAPGARVPRAAQLIRRRDGGLTFDPLDWRLAQAVLHGAGRRR